MGFIVNDGRGLLLLFRSMLSEDFLALVWKGRTMLVEIKGLVLIGFKVLVWHSLMNVLHLVLDELLLVLVKF